MELREQLLEIERELWTSGPDAYREHLAEDCLIAFSDDMAGVTAREKIAGSAAGAPRWRDLDLDPRGFLRPSNDMALLTYHAKASRGDGEHYQALVSSAYLHSGDEWRMVFHQQTPLAG